MSKVTLTAEAFNALIAERDALRGELHVVKLERDLLQEKLKAYLRKLFAAKSEARGTDQADLFLNEAEALGGGDSAPALEDAAADPIPVAGPQRAKRGRRPLDPALPREVVRHELPEAERICPHDGATLVEIGVETSEQLDIIPQLVRVIQHQRVKYACPCCDQSIKVSPTPLRIIPKGLLTDAALAWVVTSKYQDAPPLYRHAPPQGEISKTSLVAHVRRIGQMHGLIRRRNRGAGAQGAGRRRSMRGSSRGRC